MLGRTDPEKLEIYSVYWFETNGTQRVSQSLGWGWGEACSFIVLSMCVCVCVSWGGLPSMSDVEAELSDVYCP